MSTKSLLLGIVCLVNLAMVVGIIVLIFYGRESIGLVTIVGGAVVGLLHSTVAFIGIAREQGVGTAGKVISEPDPPPEPLRLTPSFSSGLFGGLIAGAFAGLIVGMGYYLSIREGLVRILQIIVYSSSVGMVLGAASQLSILGLRRLANKMPRLRLAFNEVNGGILGGLIAGVAMGAFGGWFFGRFETSFPNPTLMVLGALPGGVGVVLGVLLYDYRGKLKDTVRAISVSVGTTVVAAMLGFAISSLSPQIEDFFVLFFQAGSVSDAILGGVIIGSVIGTTLGVQIGFALFWYRNW